MGCRLVNEFTGSLVCDWKPPEDKNISVVAANNGQIVAAAGQHLYYLTIHKDSIKLEG